MTGIYLKCECCEATIGGEQVTKNPEPPLRRHQGQELRRRAAERGWKSNGRSKDWCPQHAAESEKVVS